MQARRQMHSALVSQVRASGRAAGIHAWAFLALMDACEATVTGSATRVLTLQPLPPVQRRGC